MALGGIPVSGGTTGNGTLISCNLLYSPLMRDAYGVQAARPAYTLGGTAGATGFEIAFAADRDPATLYKTAASTDDQSVTMIHGASQPTVYGVVLVGHNLTEAGVSLAKFEGGMDTDYDTVSEDLVINAALLTPAYHLLASPQAYDHWRIRVNFVASTAFQIGEIFLVGNAPLAFTANYSWGAVTNLELGQITTSGIGGVPRTINRWERLYMALTFTGISSAQLTALRLVARNGHAIFSPDGANGRAYFGVFQIEQATERYNLYDVTATFTEAAS